MITLILILFVICFMVGSYVLIDGLVNTCKKMKNRRNRPIRKEYHEIKYLPYNQ